MGAVFDLFHPQNARFFAIPPRKTRFKKCVKYNLGRGINDSRTPGRFGKPSLYANFPRNINLLASLKL
jgi:hypothetical protein